MTLIPRFQDNTDFGNRRAQICPRSSLIARAVGPPITGDLLLPARTRRSIGEPLCASYSPQAAGRLLITHDLDFADARAFATPRQLTSSPILAGRHSQYAFSLLAPIRLRDRTSVFCGAQAPASCLWSTVLLHIFVLSGNYDRPCFAVTPQTVLACGLSIVTCVSARWLGRFTR
jgi:hypothetical protein